MTIKSTFTIQTIKKDKAGHTPSHIHGEGQIFCIFSGLMTIRTETGIWAMPPDRLGWVPAHCSHSAEIHGPVSGFNIHIDEEKSQQLPKQTRVMAISVLMKGLIERLVEATIEDSFDDPEERILNVLVDEMIRAQHEPLLLPMPTDARLTRITLAIINEPNNKLSLDKWAVNANMSRRSFTRRFKLETGLSFGQWRIQAKFYHGLQLLSEGASVTQVAFELGYNSVSSFIHSFKNILGVTPSNYFKKSIIENL